MSDDDGFDLKSLAIPAYGPSLLFGLAEGAMLPVVPLSARDLGASVAIAALMVTVINIGSLVFNVPASVLTARYGERHAIVGASAIGVVAAILCLSAPGIAVYTLGALLMGVSGSVFLLARQTYLTDAVPHRYRARALSTLGGVMRVGIFAGPFLGAAAMQIAGIRAAYVVCALSLVIAGVLAATMKDLPATSTSGESSNAPTIGTILGQHRRVFLTVGIGVLLVAAVRTSRQAVIPLWAEHLGLSAQVASVIYGVAGGIDMLVFYPAGKVMDVFGRRWVTAPSMLVMAACLLVMPLTSGAVTLSVVSGVLGFGNGIGSGMVMTLGADFSPALGRTRFLGIWRELSDLGRTAGPGILSAVTAAVSLGTGIVVAGVVGLAAAAVMWRSVPGKHQLTSVTDGATDRRST